jgi:hypothetical protein
MTEELSPKIEDLTQNLTASQKKEFQIDLLERLVRKLERVEHDEIQNNLIGLLELTPDLSYDLVARWKYKRLLKKRRGKHGNLLDMSQIVP